MEIIPSIIADNFEEVKTKIARLVGLVNWVELDITDGVFVPNITWQAPEDLKEVDGKIKISAHLMVEHPETIIEDWQELVDRIIVHYESTDELEKIIDLPRGSEATSRRNYISLGVALELNTVIEKIYPYLDRIKLVQLMSVERIGYAGEKFNEQVFGKIKALKANWPDVQIIVDGGIDLEIGKRLEEAGVDGLVVGSRIWQADNIEGAIRDFQSL